MHLLKTLRLTSTILDKIRWNINPSSCKIKDGEMARFVFRVAFVSLTLGQRGLSFPVNICTRIVRVCNVLSVLVFTNIQKISVVHSFIACVAIFPNELYIGRESSFKEMINNSRKYRTLFILPSHHQNMSRKSIQGL